MELLRVVCLLLTYLTVTYGQLPVIDLCENCTIINGAAYNNHPTDCDKFVQCHFNHWGQLVGVIQKCAFSTYWDMNKLTCVPYDEVTCKTDKCKGLPDLTVFEAQSNCRGYWECIGERAAPKCCPMGYRYEVATGCVEDIAKTCKDRCFNEEAEKQLCDKREIPGNPNFFEQYLEGFGYIPMPCAPGTVYSKDACSCDDYTKVTVEKKKCEPEVYLPFDKNTNDMSGNNFYVANENVDVKNGVAQFDGSSRLIIPRFTNLEHSTTFVIKISYKPSATAPATARAIVSNSDCGNFPSIMISEDAENITFGVGTSTKMFDFTSIPRQKTATTQELTFIFDNGVLTGSDGITTSSINVPGTLRNVRCALHIGDADNMESFVGEIHELTVYLCNPDKP